MTDKTLDDLLDRDWGEIWDSLPDAPPYEARPKEAQLTLRIPTPLLAELKTVGAARSLPYHALARAWIQDALGSGAKPGPTGFDEEPNDAQLNLKVDQRFLDSLKRRSAEYRRPYHAVARAWVAAAVERELAELERDRTRIRLRVKDLMVLLLHSPGHSGEEAIHGMTRLQKLLFVLEQEIAAGSSPFYAYNYGPFSEEVHDAAEALRLAGFLRGGASIKASTPSFEEMVATAESRSGPRDGEDREVFALTEAGHQAAERLRRSGEAYERLFRYVSKVRVEWDAPRVADIVDRVYERWPDFAEKSVILDEVNARRSRRHSK